MGKEVETAITNDLDLLDDLVMPEVVASGEVESPRDYESEQLAALKHNAGFKLIEEYLEGRIAALRGQEFPQDTPAAEYGYLRKTNDALIAENFAILNIVNVNYEHEEGKRRKGGKK